MGRCPRLPVDVSTSTKNPEEMHLGLEGAVGRGEFASVKYAWEQIQVFISGLKYIMGVVLSFSLSNLFIFRLQAIVMTQNFILLSQLSLHAVC